MQAELVTRRRALLVIYRRWLDADRALALALRDARTVFPSASRPPRWTIGAPGSPVRRLHEQRERALLQLQAARLKLAVAKARLDARRGGGTILLLPMRPDAPAA